LYCNNFCERLFRSYIYGNKQIARAFTPWVEIEDNYRKYGSQDEFSMKPRFYNLSRTDFNNQDAPKLDGLVNFAYKLL